VVNPFILEIIMIQILLHAPGWLWPLLLVLIALGWRMSHTRSVPPQPAIIISSTMLLLAAYGVISSFQGSALALLVWLKLLSATLLVSRKKGHPQGWQFDANTGRMQVPGSWLPLALFLGIFSVKFAVGAALAIHPTLAHQVQFVLPVSALYGLFSGIFAARAWHAWRISRPAVAQ
jgi:hypothetical protein